MLETRGLAHWCWLVWLLATTTIVGGHTPPRERILASHGAKSIGPRTQRLWNSMSTFDADPRWSVKTPDKLDRSNTNATLVPYALEPLPFGSIKPTGWMKDQLQVMANGLPGHLHEFYRLVAQGRATWLGGTEEYSILNEAWPYWYNGLVPLAYSLDDSRLRDVINDMTNYVLEHQISDGWFGPETDTRKRNFWGRYPFLLGLMQLVDVSSSLPSADSAAQTEKILDAVHHFVNLTHGMLANNSQGYISHSGDDFDQQWGRSRAADMVVFLQWLYEKHPRDNSQVIYDCMVGFHDGSYDWSYWFQPEVFYTGDFDVLKPDVRDAVFPYIHGVNAGQGLKYGAVMRRLANLDKYVDNTRQGVNMTMEYHGAPSGAIVGDEALSGQIPNRGAELCSVVETMYSLTYNYQALGDKYYADRAELAAYNALPVMHTPDWWAHQYIATSNQPVVQSINKPPFWNVGANGTKFGTEPNYPCCAVNHPQGFPKFLSASFTKRGSNGIAHALLMPAEVNTTLANGSNEVNIRCDTRYPFENILTYTIKATSAFDFSFRVPAWSSGHVVSINAQTIESTQYDEYTGLATVNVPAATTNLEVTFITTPRIEQRANDTISIHYGALLYALPVQADYTSEPSPNITNAPAQAREYTIRPRNGTIWNVAIDPATVQVKNSSSSTDQGGDALANPIWTIDAPPTRLVALACEVENWGLIDQVPQNGTTTNGTDSSQMGGGYVDVIPPEGQRKCSRDAFEVELQPYGALKVHVAEFPIFDMKQQQQQQQQQQQ